MRAFRAIVVLAAALVSGTCLAEDLSASKAEELLLPLMPGDCGSYYTTQGDPDFADLEGKYICSFKPKVTRIVMGNGTAIVEYTHDRHFDNDLSAAWLADCSKMEAHSPPSPLYKKLRSNLEKWRANGGVDSGYRPAKASFKLSPQGWQVDSAPQ